MTLNPSNSHGGSQSELSTPDVTGSDNSEPITVTTGDAEAGDVGSITITSGTSQNGAGGDITIGAGEGDTSDGEILLFGDFVRVAGPGGSGQGNLKGLAGQQVQIQGGDGGTGEAGGNGLLSGGGGDGNNNIGGDVEVGGGDGTGAGGTVRIMSGPGSITNGTVQIIAADFTTPVIEVDLGKLGFFDTAPVTRPVVPLTGPTAQDVIDALLALGLVSQSD